MEEKKYSIKDEQTARFCKALSHPARIAIMKFLAQQDQCYFGDIHEELPIAQATVSQHLRELKNAGLIKGTIEAPKVKYCIDLKNWAYARELVGGFFDTDIKKFPCSCK
ncbi:MAG: metalloregulator ArsR/SmtB family transcription factor [Prevotellaceae bacterium]|nr:metalloregulator ArsR/SmtB family transcription factor [Prevotella sp.]MDD7258568.1 metalloregulator ArsR/SmtB family transcription factor [Prevotellaceae bacterium]MDY6131486.1 metalloregulator ArsR/SmtB family transcription factor [Prevotella sp.]